ILPREWPELPKFASQPVGTGPYAVVRNNSNQLKIHAFDDYFGYRALIDEVNFWVLPEIGEELSCAVQLEGPTRDADEKAVESRLEEGCYYLLFDSRSRVGAMPEVRRWISSRFTPARLLHRAAPQYQRIWFPAYGLLPRWHHAP
ncbi:transcriptional regulator SgrR, partial [Salmonella enterica subsp. enterica serovar Oslo]